ncbi:DUF1698 domain-containing protein [Fulvivirga maritima]|uniref:class I SAM-dependent methyltransferase n=1 Tax=Fulvivirga maritima TaxID=2904247 RepID=UPI001F20EFDD|nr:class I SAM-dependent methyltransferase [Fulvivirga maritima]UII28668.1 DUF1698 domain-containing protein [Fulvivirga maritima]
MSVNMYVSIRFLICALPLVIYACQPQDKKEAVQQVIIADSSDEDEGHPFESLVQNYEAPDRGNWQNPQMVLNKLLPLKGKTIADIGAGTGYFTFRMADQGAEVIAVDIDERFLSYIDEHKAELPREQRSRISTRISAENDPLLEAGEVDGALVVNTYYFLGDRTNYLKKILNAITTNGTILIVDYKQGDLPVGPQEINKVSPAEVANELKAAGFTDIKNDNESLPYQYMITATKP